MIALIIGGIILLGDNDDSSQSASENTNDEQQREESTENAIADKQEETTATETDTEQKTAEDTATEKASTPLGVNPSSLFLNLARSTSVDGTQTGSEQQTASDLGDDPVAIRQEIVEQFESLGISEEDLADFLAAYDTLTDESVIEKLESLTREEALALEASFATAAESIFEDMLTCLEPLLTSAFTTAEPDLDAIEELAEETTRCMVGSLNEFGRQLIAVLEEHEII